jgi:hypothetical protein
MKLRSVWVRWGLVLSVLIVTVTVYELKRLGVGQGGEGIGKAGGGGELLRNLKARSADPLPPPRVFINTTAPKDPITAYRRNHILEVRLY